MRVGHEFPSPLLRELQAQIAEAHRTGIPLRIVGGDTKQGWWCTAATETLSFDAYTGIVAYAPSELVLTARAGTRLTEIQAVLAEAGQMLGFEPPLTGLKSTLGGSIAAALSGPARPYRGAVRDFVLGVRMVTDTGEIVRFGGQVMKNVAGYDLSRLATGSWGRLGPLTEISLRVVPQPARTLSLRWRCNEQSAWQRMRALGRETFPLSACRYEADTLHVRLSGAAPAIADALRKLAPEASVEGDDDWAAWRDFTHPFFHSRGTLWRALVPSATPPLQLTDARCAWDWGGALRWYVEVRDPAELREKVGAAGGHVALWPSVTAHAEPAARALAERVRASFDPRQIFNPPYSCDES